MRLRLCDEDREQYGGPEWLEWSATVEWLNNLDGDALIALDEELGPHLPEAKGPLLWLANIVQLRRVDELYKMRVSRAWAWLQLRAAGVDIDLPAFKPRLLAMRAEFDTNPPSGGEASSPKSTPDSQAASPESETSTSASTPGSPSDTPE